jgi:AcrR family transcriptional regulator
MSVDMALRERKKMMTRRAILDAADRLFAKRGFDDVTVAEIADAANVSVKTLFVYFRSKEDLVFDDDPLLDALVGALASRPAGTPAAVALANALLAQIRQQSDGVVGLFDWRRVHDESPALQSALLRRWARFEDRISEELAREKGRPPTAATRLRAIQLVGLIRTAASAEVRAGFELDLKDANSLNKFARWIRKTARSIEE